MGHGGISCRWGNGPARRRRCVTSVIPVKILDGRIRVSTADLQAFLDALPEGYDPQAGLAPGKPVRGEHRAGAAWEGPAPGAPNRD